MSASKCIVVEGHVATGRGLQPIICSTGPARRSPWQARDWSCNSLAAVVVGGVALAGGAGTNVAAFFGFLVLGLLSNALNVAGVLSFLQILLGGVVILVAVIVDRLRGSSG